MLLEDVVLTSKPCSHIPATADFWASKSEISSLQGSGLKIKTIDDEFIILNLSSGAIETLT